ncbi:MarR family transcriptional regulator [uncultured Cellulomonas sp.]|uniref:MarR family winged helix-turn-helix transcriptional regulator n=1 Tax=uncultured Cellulomonas sp. TaxID=189682 RepID=UPI0028E9B81A|nr:MarR family transcriptional regulator [uncultured Cellulomonas sp.]
MSQGVELETSIGYLLKEASSVLHVAMDAVLRPLDLTITQYSCLELLAQRPGLSSSDLARGAFVSRQSMHVLLQQLAREGLVSRAEQAPVGRVLPTQITALGRERLAGASTAVAAVESRMVDALPAGDRAELRRLLRECVAALADG